MTSRAECLRKYMKWSAKYLSPGAADLRTRMKANTSLIDESVGLGWLSLWYGTASSLMYLEMKATLLPYETKHGEVRVSDESLKETTDWLKRRFLNSESNLGEEYPEGCSSHVLGLWFRLPDHLKPSPSFASIENVQYADEHAPHFVRLAAKVVEIASETDTRSTRSGPKECLAKPSSLTAECLRKYMIKGSQFLSPAAAVLKNQMKADTSLIDDLVGVGWLSLQFSLSSSNMYVELKAVLIPFEKEHGKVTVSDELFRETSNWMKRRYLNEAYKHTEEYPPGCGPLVLSQLFHLPVPRPSPEMASINDVQYTDDHAPHFIRIAAQVVAVENMIGGGKARTGNKTISELQAELQKSNSEVTQVKQELERMKAQLSYLQHNSMRSGHGL